MKKVLPLFIVIMATFLIPACQKDSVDVTYYYYQKEDYAVLTKYLNLPDNPFNYSRNGSVSGQVVNHQEAAKGALGRVLFYDKNLSADGKISCASCHLQSHAFSDTTALSTGIHGRKTFRNSLALGSVKSFVSSYGGGGSSSSQFFWDDRASDLKQQCIETFNNPDEMGITIKEVVRRASETEYYPILAKYIHPESPYTFQMDSTLVLDALATFMNAMVSEKSKFDQGMSTHKNNTKVDFSNFTAQENLGKSLFQTNCSNCHGSNFARSTKARANNGLAPNDNDPGRFMITGNEQDRNVFKVPVLRNVALTAPYMHDGRFRTLEEVLNHYSEGIVLQDNLDPSLTVTVLGMKRAKNFQFTDTAKSALIAFLKTLTDESLNDDPRFSDPFK